MSDEQAERYPFSTVAQEDAGTACRGRTRGAGMRRKPPIDILRTAAADKSLREAVGGHPANAINGGLPHDR